MEARKPCFLPDIWARFKKNLTLLKSSFFNYVFLLDKKGARNRMALLVLSALTFWFVLTSQTLDRAIFRDLLQKSFSYILRRQAENASAVPAVVSMLSAAMFSPRVFRLFALFIFPFVSAFLSAVKYLADIYELKDENVAAKFIWQAAFGSKYSEITIEKGSITEKSRKSPIYKIGGPGKVKIDLYSAALFEKPDGRPHVLSATSKNVELQAFERYKTAVDLRDQVVAPVETSSRTLEGIKVSAKDVRMVYSVLRGDAAEKKEYSFKKEAIPNYFYQKGASVSAYAKKGFSDSPLNPTPGMVKGELGGFISRHKLSEFLTAVGAPEKGELKERATKYQEERERVGKVINKAAPPLDKDYKAPDFQTRDNVNELFLEFADDFSKKKNQKGVSLYWVGTGTWMPPDDIIHKKNMEAWELTQKNAQRGKDGKLKDAEKGETVEETLRLIKGILVAATSLATESNTRHDVIVDGTLEVCREMIKNAKDLFDIYEKEDEFKNLKEADLNKTVAEINRVIKYHSPTSR